MRIELESGWRATLTDDTDAGGAAWCVVRLHPCGGGGEPTGLADGLRPALQERGATRVLIEMDEVAFLSSSLIGELVRIHKRSAMAGGALHLSAFQPACFEALRVCRLDRVLNHFLNRAEALAGR
ncbi:MAG: STAS domain-containing protein [Planctomycetota bacterium]